MFHLRSVRDRDAYDEATPADDVFALGVTAYHLVMGEYPPPVVPSQDETGAWQVVSPDPRPFLERNPSVEPRLRELILRMLSEAPEARGSAAELAEALEAAAADGLAWRPWLALAAAGLAAVLLWPSRTVHAPPEHVSVSMQQASTLGDSPPPARPVSSERKPVAQSPLPEPRPGQLRPDKKGQCLSRKHLALNGGCWVEQSPMTTQECAQSGYAYSQGKCYAPALAPPQEPVPTSSPAKPR